MSTATPARDPNAVVEVEFEVRDPAYPLVAIPARTGCRARVQQIVPRSQNSYAIFYSVEGADPEEIVALLADSEGVEGHVVTRGDEEGIVEVRVRDPEEHFVVALTEAGAIPTDLWSADGAAHIVAEIPGMYSVQEVVEAFTAAHPSVEVVAQRQKGHTAPLFTRREFQRAVDEALTPRQREVVVAAYAGGYYDWPRRKSGEEIAAELGISLATFSQHVRKAEQKILALVFEEWQAA
ncbi:bacterio-opsin activator domain-containing protein [Halorussus sp. AFM4]|uniref:bacterio-opsin activator domain-containing protein n=1 Tax=Halorussus sp. AFM4 TaxID=3421651 RepID=UPI003EBAE4D3